jgi:hypothetical protein
LLKISTIFFRIATLPIYSLTNTSRISYRMTTKSIFTAYYTLLSLKKVHFYEIVPHNTYVNTVHFWVNSPRSTLWSKIYVVTLLSHQTFIFSIKNDFSLHLSCIFILAEIFISHFLQTWGQFEMGLNFGVRFYFQLYGIFLDYSTCTTTKIFYELDYSRINTFFNSKITIFTKNQLIFFQCSISCHLHYKKWKVSCLFKIDQFLVWQARFLSSGHFTHTLRILDTNLIYCSTRQFLKLY